MATRYLVGLTREQAEARNHTEALRRGCFSDPEHDGTLYWWAMEKHPEREEWTIKVPEDDEEGLTTRERSELKDEATVRADGWRSRRSRV